jgi:chromosome segregation ATPase
MPSISNDSAPAVDYVTYFTKQFPKDLANMAALRDELEKRQGALTAVEDANKLRMEADEYAAKTKADVDGLLSDARDKNRRLDAARADLDSAAASFRQEAEATEKTLAAREKEVAAREKTVASRMTALDAKDVELQNQNAKLVSAQVEFDARVKAFQERVASLSV